MSEIVPNSSSEEGNTHNPSSPANTAKTTDKKKQVSPRVHHFFTYNNYDSSIVPILETTFKHFCYMYCFQEETGADGTRHLQGVISCKKKMRDTEFGLPKQIHWEKPINVKDCYLYCSKKETRTGGVFTFNYELPYEYKVDLYGWQTDLMDKLRQPIDNRKVFWYWSNSGGLGKSTMTKHLVVNEGAVFCSTGKQADIINIVYNTDMSKCKLVVFDLPRNNKNKVSYAGIEAIKNGLICNTKFETGFKAFEPPNIVIFANAPPQDDSMSIDRWDIVCLDEMVLDE